MSTEELLTVEDLRTVFHTSGGDVGAVDGVSLTLRRGETLGIVGESGSGKSVLGRTAMGLVASGATTTVSGRSVIAGHDVHRLRPAQRRRLWGPEVAMVFQDPMTSLNPVKKVGTHLTETLRLHFGTGKSEARQRAGELMRQVGIPEPERRLDQYPHELSGGMRQRVVIAMALACDPTLLIADEPTTALDVTVQRQILDLLGSLADQLGMATILISHDLGAVAGRTDRVAVMYAGRIVESSATERVFTAPRHPYSEALLASIPRFDAPPHTRLVAVGGQPPNMLAPPPGCRFAPRCPHAAATCTAEVPLLRSTTEGTTTEGTTNEGTTNEGTADGGIADGAAHTVACHYPLESKEVDHGR